MPEKTHCDPYRFGFLKRKELSALVAALNGSRDKKSQRLLHEIGRELKRRACRDQD